MRWPYWRLAKFFPPLPSLCDCLLLSQLQRPPPIVQATMLLGDTSLDLDDITLLLDGRHHLFCFHSCLTQGCLARLALDSVCSLLPILPRPGSLHLGLVLSTPELSGSVESISCFQHSDNEIAAHWKNAINTRLTSDKIIATKIKHENKFTNLVKNTWKPLLTKEGPLLHNWINNSKVLVGRRP